MFQHPVMLCQPDKNKSCAACCGLYNRHDHSRHAIESILKIQTEYFQEAKKSDALLKNQKQCQKHITNKKLFDTIYNCEFVGYIDHDHKRIGCLLHPASNTGEDLRHYGFYGTKTCSEHFCPSYANLTTTEQKAVVQVSGDWYLYGLVITDIDLVKEFFKQVQDRIGDNIKGKHLQSPAVADALHDFFSLKENWEFKSPENRLGKYYFSRAEYSIARIEYQKRWCINPSRFDKILISLESDFQTKEDLHEAESLIEDTINHFIKACKISDDTSVP
jgi:hypothetical protein